MGNENFSTLVAALKAADLVGALQSEGPFTVFAPTNDAFAKIDSKTLSSLLEPANKETLTKILTYHVVAGQLNAADVVAFNEAPTATSQASVAATVSVQKEIVIAGTDPEGDTLSFTLLRLPGNGSLVYSNTQNQATTVSCDGGTVNFALGNSTLLYTASSTGTTTLQFKVNDGQQDSGTGTVTINVSS